MTSKLVTVIFTEDGRRIGYEFRLPALPNQAQAFVTMTGRTYQDPSPLGQFEVRFCIGLELDTVHRVFVSPCPLQSDDRFIAVDTSGTKAVFTVGQETEIGSSTHHVTAHGWSGGAILDVRTKSFVSGALVPDGNGERAFDIASAIIVHDAIDSLQGDGSMRLLGIDETIPSHGKLIAASDVLALAGLALKNRVCGSQGLINLRAGNPVLQGREPPQSSCRCVWPCLDMLEAMAAAAWPTDILAVAKEYPNDRLI